MRPADYEPVRHQNAQKLGCGRRKHPLGRFRRLNIRLQTQKEETSVSSFFYPIPSEHLSDGINIKTYRPFCDIIQAICQDYQTLCRLKHACRTLSAP
ncbi:hypothetical protein COH59_09115 [Neisseria meningitidis]|nr:hypothetical protein COH59_09115 [Neisseria meningitidis]